MTGFTLLWSKIIRSSIWIKESKEARLLWITMLAMKDSKGEIHSSFIGLADSAKISPDECRAALKVLMSPDEDDTSKVDRGIRVKEIPGGWFIVNHDLYRFSSEEKREFWRQQKAEQAAKKKRLRGDGGKVSAAYRASEKAAVEAYENGDDSAFDKETQRRIHKTI